jgi:hypothetical protein
MEQSHPPPAHDQSHHERNGKVSPLWRDIDEPDVHALIEENARLRKLVIQLSKLVIKNVMDRREGPSNEAALIRRPSPFPT